MTARHYVQSCFESVISLLLFVVTECESYNWQCNSGQSVIW